MITEASKLKAATVWVRLLDSFGDALQRKYPGKEPPTEWVLQLASLRQEYIDRAFRRMMSAGLSQPPTLPQFMRFARAVGDDNDTEALPQPTQALPGPPIAPWVVQGNLWLLAYVRAQLAENPQRWGRPASRAALQLNPDQLKADGTHPHKLDASPEFVANVGRLAEAKNQWAADMEDLGRNDPKGRVPMPTAKAIWADYIERAEHAIVEGYADAPLV